MLPPSEWEARPVRVRNPSSGSFLTGRPAKRLRAAKRGIDGD